MPQVSSIVVAFSILSFSTNAFICQPANVHRWKASSSLEASYDPYSSGDSFKKDNYKSRTDLRQFLTQRSIQSFVFLLNQCKEGMTVRWLEKQLDFKKIDTFHGTGAFNTTLFPEWDSFFLQMVVQDLETIVIEVEAQKKSHRGWAHQGNYLDGIGSGNGEPSTDAPSSVPKKSSSESGPRKSGPSGNYLNNLNSVSSSPTSSAPKMKPKWQPASRQSGATNSYLESLNQPKETKSEADDMKSGKKDGINTTPTADGVEMKNGGQSPTAPKTSGRRGGSYLDGLTSNTIESGNQDETPTPSKGVIENPHLESKTIEYQFEVDPASLVTRMLSVREQIAKEWKDDLATLVRTNERILDEYEEQQRVAAAAEDDEDDDDGGEVHDRLEDLYRASQEDGKTVLYDRSAMVYLTNSIATQGQAASPFRRSNFDLLLLLCTQESVHRVLNEYKSDTDDEMHNEKHAFLNSFYKQNVKKYFDGHDYSFGRGDQFLEAFLKESPIARTTQKGNLSLIDPVAIMEDILRQRSVIAREWKSIVDTIPDEHLDLRRLLFNRHLMESSNWDSPRNGKSGIYFEESASIQTVSEPGAFE